MYLNDFITINNKIARSVNLERDASNIEQIQNFQITPMARHVLKRFIDALEGEPVTAWSLTGPYGTGKSAFCNYFFALCAGERDVMGKMALANLKNTDVILKKKFISALQYSGIKGFIPLRSVSQHEPLNKTLLNSLNIALLDIKCNKTEFTSLKKKVISLMDKTIIPTSEIIKVLKQTSQITGKKLLIVIDEFGKNLEYMTHNPSEGDIFVLQALAESNFSYIWVCLHQAFSEYASALSRLQFNEWNKVQGRFEDISYIEPPLRVIELISKSLKQKKDVISRRSVSTLDLWCKKHVSLINELKIPGVPKLDKKTIKNLYPIHPLAAVILGELSHRFAQNDRTIFSFLSSGAPKSFSGFLSSHRINGTWPIPTLGLDWLYNYFCEVTTQIHGNRITTQRWIEIQTLISEYKDVTPLELCLLKNIGVLNLLSQIPGISASRKMLHVALGITDPDNAHQVDDALKQLVTKRIVLYRNYADEYRIWEGTDFDIEKAIVKERDRLSLGTLEKILEIAAPQQNVIAARHSFQTGVVREFTQSWTTLDILDKRDGNDLLPGKTSDGHIWLTLGITKFPKILMKKTQNFPVIIGYASYEHQVLELALDAAAAKKVFETHHQLARDGVARREARFRADAAADILNKFLTELASSANKKIQWYACGKALDFDRYHGLSSIVSSVCDAIYYTAPHVHMEMINHNRLTSAAARAQRVLIEAMVTNETEENLGLDGFGPEVAIYLAMFKSTGLHKLKSAALNTWHFIRPEAEEQHQKQLFQVWNMLDNLLAKSDIEGSEIPLQLLIEKLQQPPYGLRKGPIPLFICHYIIVNDDEIAVYQEGIFKPFFGKADAALLLKRPDLFELRMFSSHGLKREIIQAYMMALNTNVLNLEIGTRNQSLLKIVAPLIQFMQHLPEYTRFTKRMTIDAQKLRNTVLNSREPFELLFRDIPDVLGMPHIEPENTSKLYKTELFQKLQNALIELNEAFNILNNDIQDSIKSSFLTEENCSFSQFRKKLQNRMQKLVIPCRDKELKTILKTILNVHDDDTRWAQGIAGVILKKPLDSWRDSDIEPWYATIKEIAERIDCFEALVADTVDITNGKRILLSLTQSNGETQRSIINISLKEKKYFLKKYPGIKKLNRKEREMFCAILLEDTGEKNAK